MNNLKNIDKLEMVGELLLDLSSQANEGNIIVVRSDDERLKGLGISEIENLIIIISEESESFFGYEKHEEGYDDKITLTRFSIIINALTLRDYLIEAYGKNKAKSIPKLQEKYMDKQILYWIDFDKNGFIILNNKYQLSRMEYGSNSYEIFSFLFKNERKDISKEKIEKNKIIEITRSLSKTLDEIGFKKQLKKLFLKSSRKKVMFRNKVTRGEIKELKIDEDLLKKQIKELKTYQR